MNIPTNINEAEILVACAWQEADWRGRIATLKCSYFNTWYDRCTRLKLAQERLEKLRGDALLKQAPE